MSKRILAVFLAFGVLATSNAFASRARQLVLGSGDPLGVLSAANHGSFYYNDNYNIFYNPAYINDYKNWATVEKANSSSAGATSEGGFVTGISEFNLGLFLNRVDVVANGTSYNASVTPVRPVEIMFGGDAGVKWGVGYTFASNRVDANNDSTDMTLRAGVAVSDFEPFAQLRFGSKQKVAGAETKFSGMLAGLRYHWGEWTPYVAYRMNKATPPAGSDQKSTNWGLGLGRNMKVSDGVMLNYALGYWRQSVNSTGNNRTVVPVDISVEGEMASWLVGRAGLTYNFADRTNNVSAADATSGRLGAGIKVAKLEFDFAVGHTANGAAEDVQGNGFGFDSGFFTAGSLTYKW